MAPARHTHSRERSGHPGLAGGRAKSLSTFCHSRLPISHRGESRYHPYLTNEGLQASHSYGHVTARPEALKQRFSAGRPRPPGDIWRHLWVSQPGENTAGTRGWGPGMMLNILPCTGQTPTQKIMISSKRPQCPGRQDSMNVCSTVPGA